MGMPENDEPLLGSDRLKGILFGNYTPLEINAALTPLEQSLSNEESVATWKAIGESLYGIHRKPSVKIRCLRPFA